MANMHGFHDSNVLAVIKLCMCLIRSHGGCGSEQCTARQQLASHAAIYIQVHAWFLLPLTYNGGYIAIYRQTSSYTRIAVVIPCHAHYINMHVQLFHLYVRKLKCRKPRRLSKLNRLNKLYIRFKVPDFVLLNFSYRLAFHY